MSYIDSLCIESECVETLYQDYIQSKSKYEIFIFFEGKNDFKYYDVRIKQFITGKKNIHFVCNGKQNVLTLHSMILNQTSVNKSIKLLFFVDKDFDRNIEISKDIYVTPVYSIENFYISNEAFENIIKGEMGFSGELKDDDIKDFDSAVNYLLKSRKTIIDSILYANSWYSIQKNEYNLDGNCPKLSEIKDYKKIKGVNDVNVLKNLVPNAIDVEENDIVRVFYELSVDPVKMLRGKYFDQAMPEYFNYMFRDSCKKTGRKYFIKKRKISLHIDSGNMLSMFSHYAETPICLTKYIKDKVS